jgi:DNA polymerase-3 subunit epsilon
VLSESLVVLDFETTGLSPLRGDRITEVAVVRINGDRIIDRYESLVNCGVRVPPFITDYTGISQRMVDTAPPVTQVLRELLGFIGNSAVVAHNASFDQRFFASECERSGMSVRDDAFICTLRLARRIYPHLRSHALGELARQLRLMSSGAAHRAGADAEVTAGLVLRLCADLTARHAGLAVDARLLRQIMKTPANCVNERLVRLAQH